jgi:hypothetical protein
LQASIEAARPVLERVATDVTALAPLQGRPLVQPLMATSAQLYVAVVDLQEAALDLDDELLAGQVDLMARRTRVLSDRIFDRARVLLDPDEDVVDPDITMSLPEEVPQWPEEQLAAGPPLAEQPEAPDDLYPQRQDQRPVQAERAWRGAVEEVSAPSADAVMQALAASDSDTLGALADELLSAVELLRSVPDPEGPDGRERHARLRLGVLLRSEAARVGQAAALIDGPLASVLTDAARTLANHSAAMALAGELGDS